MGGLPHKKRGVVSPLQITGGREVVQLPELWAVADEKREGAGGKEPFCKVSKGLLSGFIKRGLDIIRNRVDKTRRNGKHKKKRYFVI